jgi:hypothetical protein
VARKTKKLVDHIQEKLLGKEDQQNVQEELDEMSVQLASLDMNVCPLDGILPPKLTGHFYAMSVYFFAIDCIRHHGHFQMFSNWPTPKLNIIEKAAHSFCAVSWEQIQKAEKHKYTRSHQLHSRCFEGLYISTLLEHGFGIDGSQKMVTLALEVEGVEVEWTLGFALAELR